MKHRFGFLTLLLPCCALPFAAVSTSGATGPASGVYELRIYTAHPGKLDAVLARFRDHTCELFKKHGMTNVAYFVPMDGEPGAGEKLVYLLRHDSREAAAASFAAFRSDPAWHAARDASEADGKIVASVESVFLTPTDYSAAFTPGAGGSQRVFEMRSYRTLPDRLSNLDARFRDHTCALFRKHGMTNLGYFHPIDPENGAGHTLTYFLAHDSRDAATASWKAFQADPDWIAARNASEADGKILQPKGVTKSFLEPTDFSPLK